MRFYVQSYGLRRSLSCSQRHRSVVGCSFVIPPVSSCSVRLTRSCVCSLHRIASTAMVSLRYVRGFMAVRASKGCSVVRCLARCVELVVAWQRRSSYVGS